MEINPDKSDFERLTLIKKAVKKVIKMAINQIGTIQEIKNPKIKFIEKAIINFFIIQKISLKNHRFAKAV